MWKCEQCGEIFEEPETKLVDLESEYGVADLFGDHHYAREFCCPRCFGLEITEEFDDEDEYEEEE